MNKLYVGMINKGLQTNFLPFNIDNDSFPVLINAQQWRGRVRRKRGTSLLCRLQEYFDSTSKSYTSISQISVGPFGGINLVTGYVLPGNSSLVPGTVSLRDINTLEFYTDPAMDGILVGSMGSTGTINYSTGAGILGAASFSSRITAIFIFYPNLPVMGLEDFQLDPTSFSTLIAFNTVSAYAISSSIPAVSWDVSFYKNPPSEGPYTQKTVTTPVYWAGNDYQQFYTVNFQGVFWVTNGIGVPFNQSNISMQFSPKGNITYVSNDATALTVQVTSCPLVRGDYVFVNEWLGPSGDITASDSVSINQLSGYVTSSTVDPITKVNTLIISFPNANISTAGVFTPGIIQYLTNSSDNTKDCLRWYDGDPTNSSPTSPSFVPGNGWVNFCPPLSQFNFSIAGHPAAIYYLVGARLIQPFKDRLLFIGPVIQTSVTGENAIYLPDSVIYSQNGTPYYTATFSSDPSLASTIFSPILVPDGQTATVNSWWEDQTGFGGFITSGTLQTILTSQVNEDVLILGGTKLQIRLVYTGNDIIPFNFYLIDAELTTSSTFSAINMGSGVITRGARGIILTSQRECKRIDVDILDNNFQINTGDNGSERFTAIRDYLDEVIYFTYRANDNPYIFPNQSLVYNYRENSWSIYNESYTTYGQYFASSGFIFIWSNVGQIYNRWLDWTVPWNAGASTDETPNVIGGNQQGFIMVKESGTAEGISLSIQSIFGGTDIVSPDHGLNSGDYILIDNCVGITGLNGNIFSVSDPQLDSFTLNPTPVLSGTYRGNGTITRMYNPFIQTKQFPVFWDQGRKVRIGVQKYLLSTTESGQIQLLIYLSTDNSNPYNDGPLAPSSSALNSSLIYSTVLYTCVESTNIGLTKCNSNQLMINDGGGSTNQSQIWHRKNTSLIGDTVQLGFTMSDIQMRDTSFSNQFAEIELHAFILDVYPSQLLA